MSDADIGTEQNRVELRVRKSGSASDGTAYSRDSDARAGIAKRGFAAAAEHYLERRAAGDDLPKERAKQKRAERRAGHPKPTQRRVVTISENGLAATGSGQGLPAHQGAGDGAVRRGIAPSEADREDAKKLFRAIGKRFNENRTKSRASAYSQYRHDLMENMDVLVMGGAIELKEITAVITNLEQYTRDTDTDGGKSQSQILAEWLRVDEVELNQSRIAESNPEKSA